MINKKLKEQDFYRDCVVMLQAVELLKIDREVTIIDVKKIAFVLCSKELDVSQQRYKQLLKSVALKDDYELNYIDLADDVHLFHALSAHSECVDLARSIHDNCNDSTK